MAVAAAGKVPVFKVQDEFADSENAFSYPTTCKGYMVIGGSSPSDGSVTKIHFILGTGAPGTDYDNAPDGSLYIDLTGTKLYIKGTSAWIVVGTQT